MSYIKNHDELKLIRDKFRETGKKVVFTNGVFDILHAGHVDYLNKARSMGDVLIVGLNSNRSVKMIKGEKRPIIDENERAFILAGLKAVDYVTLFDEETPENLILKLIPDILVKGADWPVEKIAGSSIVLANGGTVKNIEFVNDQSTSGIIEIILSRYS